MPGIRFPIAFEMEDGTEGEVVADQRDMAAYEQKFAAFERTLPFTLTRYMCWHALSRTKGTGLSWEDWDRLCIQAEDGPGSGGSAVADPTRPEAPAGT